MASMRFGGQRVLVIGLGREGVDVAQFLTRAGAAVWISDQKSPSELTGEREVLGDRVSYLLGGQAIANMDRFDLVVASPGVPSDHLLLRAASEARVPISSLIEILFSLCPAPILGITGSAGKTTTTSLVGEMLRREGRTVWVGGNIGKPLLGDLDRIKPSDQVVLELSSFQLERMTQSPSIAVVTNVTPNHLDRHGTMEAYWESKRQILAHQDPGDWAILNADDPLSRRYSPNGMWRQFSLERPVIGAFLAQQTLVLGDEPLISSTDLQLPGRHNVANVLAASLTAQVAGVSMPAIREIARTFKGVPHRLETVLEYGGVRWINDSIATAPERSMAALRVFSGPVVLIAGGRDKKLPMDEWAALIKTTVRHVLLFGEMSNEIAAALDRANFEDYSYAGDMKGAVSHASKIARAGDIVLLSPGGTSYDFYRDFEERGAHFVSLAQTITGKVSVL